LLWRAVRGIWAVLGRLAARRWVCVALVAAGTFAGCAALSALRGGDPVPEVHDEFAYLLAGDTFAHGRLTNPTHPLAESFETLHTLQRPSYQAKYPPGQGLALGAGEFLTGRPIVGVWMSAALMTGAMCWMLQAWAPGRWALLGAVLIAARVVFMGRPYEDGQLAYWGQSYWGGAVAALGGALVFGGVRRALEGASTGAALAMGTGAVVLAASRPYEGFLLCLPVACVVGWWVLGAGERGLCRRLLRVGVPAAAALALGGAWLLFYDHRVTGEWVRLPYMAYWEQYQSAPIWLWQEAREEPRDLSEPLRKYALWEREHAAEERSRAEVLFGGAWRVRRAVLFQIGAPMALALLLLLPWVLRDRWHALAAASAGVMLVGVTLSSFYYEHYAAPMTAPLLVLAVAALRRVGALRIGRARTGQAAVLILMALMCAEVAREWRRELHGPAPTAYAWAMQRSALEERLEAAGGKHLVMVRYGPNHSFHFERVANRADPDRAAVVWARELDAAQNERVLEYYRDRRAWLLVVDDDNAEPELEPYVAPLE
jgi:hypothetical protein